jgi:hypothetical protein
MCRPEGRRPKFLHFRKRFSAPFTVIGVFLRPPSPVILSPVFWGEGPRYFCFCRAERRSAEPSAAGPYRQ